MATSQNPLELAKQGDPKAIAQLINQALQAKGLTARATCAHGCLKVLIESEQIPNQQAIAPYLQKNISKLGIQTIHTVELHGKQTCAALPAWTHSFKLNPTSLESAPSAASKAKPAVQTAKGMPLRSPASTAQPQGRKSQQAIYSTVAAVTLILIGANLNSAVSLVARSLTPPKVTVNQAGVHQARIIDRAGGTPVIQVTFNGQHTFPMIVDTGASGTLITQSMASTLGVTSVDKVVAHTPNGMATFDVGYVQTIEVNGASANHVPVAIGLPDMQIGLLGHDFFGNFDVTVREDVVEFRVRS